ncbi:MAG: hypothetical protein H6837_15300 [Planctomycetes bacterium]|nr:hypothetical protein [Planctomycetota bacterium]
MDPGPGGSSPLSDAALDKLRLQPEIARLLIEHSGQAIVRHLQNADEATLKRIANADVSLDPSENEGKRGPKPRAEAT